MRKIYSAIICMSILSSAAFAQRTAGESVKEFRTSGENFFTNSGQRDVNDTLGAPVLDGCDFGPILLGSSNGGWVAGGNGYGDLEKAQFIDTEGTGDIYSVLAWVGAKEGGNNEMFSAFVYDGNTVDGPGTVTATSNAVDYANIDTAGGAFTTFAFDTPVAYDGGFFLSLDVVQGDAIIGIVHTNDGCGANSAWELWSDDTWISMDDSWGDMDIVMYMLAEVEASSVSSDGLNVIERGSQKVFPNPITDQSTLVYSLIENSNVTVRVFNVQGALVQTYNHGVRGQGLNVLTLDTDELNSGMYIYSIQTEKGVRNGNFQVIR